MTPYDFRTRQEILEDEELEAHQDGKCYGAPDCRRCEEEAERLCRCGHDLKDEHRRRYTPVPHEEPIETLVCDFCDVACEKVGEREAYEGKVKP